MSINIDAKLMYGLPYQSIVKNLREDSIELLNEEIYDGEWDTASPYYDSEMTSWFIGYILPDFDSSCLQQMISKIKEMDEKFQKRFGVRGYITACADVA